MAPLSPSAPAPSVKFRILEINLQSADLKTKKKGKNYVKTWIQQDRKLQTMVDDTGGAKPVWNERFVFSIPGDFFDGNNSNVSFEVYRARKSFLDSLIGTAKCNLKTLFKDIEVKKETKFEPDQEEEKECIYDTENEYSDEEEFRYDNMFESNKDISTEEIKEEKVECELKASTSLKVQKGLEFKGMLNVEVSVLKSRIKYVGNNEWGIAMNYDEFMGLQGSEEKKKKNQSWLCFAARNAADDSKSTG